MGKRTLPVALLEGGFERKVLRAGLRVRVRFSTADGADLGLAVGAFHVGL